MGASKPTGFPEVHRRNTEDLTFCVLSYSTHMGCAGHEAPAGRLLAQRRERRLDLRDASCGLEQINLCGVELLHLVVVEF